MYANILLLQSCIHVAAGKHVYFGEHSASLNKQRKNAMHLTNISAQCDFETGHNFKAAACACAVYMAQPVWRTSFGTLNMQNRIQCGFAEAASREVRHSRTPFTFCAAIFFFFPEYDTTWNILYYT
jgi:hypothetical protein